MTTTSSACICTSLGLSLIHIYFASGGNSSALQEHLRQLYARNSAENACSPFEKQLLCAHMLNTLRAAGYHEALADEIVHSLADISLARFFALLGSYYETLCQRSRERCV